ncbi:MAG: MBL fold metallo-hydrolase [Spirochaetia bacterium]|nr:MBL fold metallo-hydrolase [Spirochaetia bacterium]MCE1208136.1 MBL fold metallo-hydrolase [Spirochaetia bacterium]
MDVHIRSLGAAGEVTGSKHLVEFEGKRILVDCGAFQGRRAESDAKNRALLGDVEPGSVDAMVLTHAHYDHCGLLPYLVKKGFSGNIFATAATRDLANLVMMDSAHIQARDADYLSRQAAKRNEKFDWKPLYNDLDVVKTMGQFVTINYHRPINIAEGASVEFRDAGHILGSALVRMTLKAKNGAQRVLGFSGDLGRKNKPIIRDPEQLDGLDHLVLESTYGDKLHENTSDAVERLAEVVRSTAEAGGKVIIPAFAVERTQELVFTLHLLLDQGRIPDIPIWVDSPMAVDATGIFRIHPECYDKETHEAFTTHSKNPFGFASLHFSRSVEDSKALNEAKEPMIIISADGMCEVGRIQHHLIHNISKPQNTILIVGYMAEGTLGRRIMDGAKEVRIHGDFYKVAANVKTIDAFSAHADWRETLDWLSATDTKNLKTIFLVHGESKALESLKGKLQGAGFPSVEIVRVNQHYALV